MKIRTMILSLMLLIASQAKSQEKYAIGMFHFNLQYVAGDYRIENRIIRESLYPVLQFFEKNKKYKADIEIQGYGIEVLAEEHPEVLKLMKKLIDRGQIELVIAHYSDQLFIGYPALDMQKSIEISDKILAKHGMKRSRVLFGQEIQWTPAYASVLKGNYDLVVTSSDPHAYYRERGLPLVNASYGDDSILALIGSGEKKLDGLQWEFSFLDDGEVFNTLDYRSNFYRVPEQEKRSIDNFKRLEKEGFKFVTMSELAEKMKNLETYTIPEYEFVPEGTWNMSVCGPYMWMGRQRSGVETDGITRALSYELRGRILATEKLIDYASQKGNEVSELNELMEKAWKHLLLSEVSDASGWTPWLVEVQYTANEVANANKTLLDVEAKLKKMLPADTKLIVETQSGSVNTAQPAKEAKYVESFFPIPFAVRGGTTTTTVTQIGENLYQMDINCKRPADGAVEIVFDTPEKGLYYSAGAGEHIAVEVPAGLKHDPALALSNGFIYLNNGYSLVKDCSVEHLAATWKEKEQKLVFRQELAKTNNEMNMRFYLLKGDKNDGLKFANKVNTWPSYIVDLSGKDFSFEQIIPDIF